MKIRTVGCFTKLSGSHLAGRTAIVIDVLRAGTSIITAFMNGAEKVIPVREAGEAVTIASRMGGCVLAGERDGIKIPGFDLGNSPSEFSASAVWGKNIVMSTSNGTGAICGAEGAANILIGAMVNCTAAARRAVDIGGDVIIICAGTDRDVSADDLYAAGAIAEAMADIKGGGAELCDLSAVARLVYSAWKDDRSGFARTRHYSRLVSLGLESDVEFCLRKDVTDIVPAYRDGVLEKR